MIRQIRYYIAVVQAGSFSEAAEVCHISQSAISQQIRALEDGLQVELLERRGRRFAVTPAGQWFYQRAKRHVAEMDSTIRESWIWYRTGISPRFTATSASAACACP